MTSQDRVVADGQLHDPRERQPAVVGGAAFHPEHELVRVAARVPAWNRGNRAP